MYMFYRSGVILKNLPESDFSSHHVEQGYKIVGEWHTDFCTHYVIMMRVGGG